MKNVKNTRTGKVHRMSPIICDDFYESICGVFVRGKSAMPPATGQPDFRKCYELTSKGVTCWSCLSLLKRRSNRKHRKKGNF